MNNPVKQFIYYGLAESGFYFWNTESVVKCYFCPSKYKRNPSSKNGSQIHRMNNPACAMVNDIERVGNVQYKHELTSLNMGIILEKHISARRK